MAFLSNLVSLVTQPGVQAIGAGLLSGVVGGTALVASGVVPVGTAPEAPASIELLACPDAGPALARVSEGGQLLLTGRNEDGTWYEVYIGQPGVDRAWAPASALSIQSGSETLPIADCAAPIDPVPTLGPPPTPTPEPPPTPTAPPADSPPPSASPSATATVVAPTPTASPTKTPAPTPTKKPSPTPVKTATPPPPPTPTPTTAPTQPPPDTTPPSISNVTIEGAYHDGSGNYYINCTTPTATIRATISDSGGSGLAGFTVTLHWKDPYGTQHNQQMTYNINTGRWGSSINWNAGWPSNNGNPVYIEYWITASDNAGNDVESAHPPDSQHWLFASQYCVG